MSNLLAGPFFGGRKALGVGKTPVWTGAPTSLVLTPGTSYNFGQFAVDPQGDRRRFSLVGNVPAGYSVNRNTGVVSTASTIVDATITIRCSDGQFYADHSCSISIASVNHPPVWAGAPNSISRAVGQSILFGQYATDPDGDTLSFSLSGNPPNYVINTVTGEVTLLPGATSRQLSVVAKDPGNLTDTHICDVTVEVVNPGVRQVFYEATFEDLTLRGLVLTSPSKLAINSGSYRAKVGGTKQGEGGYNNFVGGPTALNTAHNNGTDTDCRPLRSETYGGVTITPRAGYTAFLRKMLFHDKQYECLNGATHGATFTAHDGGSTGQLNPPCVQSSLDKARNPGPLTGTDSFIDAKFCFDREVWIGMSYYFHPNWQGNTSTRAIFGGAQIFDLNAGTDRTQFDLNQFVPPASWNRGGNESIYASLKLDNSNATGEPNTWNTAVLVSPDLSAHNFAGVNGKTYYWQLGDMVADDDLGRWTDIVMRIRLNPFSTSTNPRTAGVANAVNRTFPANKGILQIWKSKGPNRIMTLVVNRFNAPVGLCPSVLGNQTNTLTSSIGQCNSIGWDQYTHGLKKNPQSWLAPRYLGYSALRFGFRKSTGDPPLQSGTKDTDVNPSGLALPGWVEQT